MDGVGLLADGRRVYFAFPRSPFGAMAEISVVDGKNWTLVPDDVDDATAAAIANPGMSSWAALTDRAQLQPGETVLINDAAALISAHGGNALVFGNSGGANISIKLTEAYPELVRGLVAHEPPVTNILPDAKEWRVFFNDVYATFLAKGAGPAMAQFVTKFVGVNSNAPQPPDQGGNAEHFFAHEFENLNDYTPDLDKLKRDGVSIVVTAGRDSKDAFYARTAREMSERLGCKYAEMSGHHISFVTHPDVFATELKSILQDF